MKKKYIKLNDNYGHLSLGNIINAIKEESKNKTSAIQSEVFCAIFNINDANISTINNYCIGSRSIGNDYKQIYINLKKNYSKSKEIFKDIICNILTIVDGIISNNKSIEEINNNESLKNICLKLYNISKNDFYVSKNNITIFRNLYNDNNYYELFISFLIYAILEKKQPIYEDDKINNMIASILQNTDISVNELQNFLVLELNEGLNFSYSLKKLAEDGNSYANYRLAIMEYRGEFTGYPRYDQAYLYFEKAAKNNHPSSYWMLGNMIIKGKVGSKNNNDYKKAFDFFHKAKELGNIAAINSIGICYQNGYGIKKDINIAKKYYEEAAKKNYAYAYNNLGILSEKENDYKNAYSYFLKSANLGESFACNRIGEYERKKGNLKTALEYYHKALESSLNEINIWAYYNIAKYYYLNGNLETNIIKDVDEAIKYFEKSSSLIESLMELLLIYFEKYNIDNDNSNLEKINYYKHLIETHPKYNKNIKDNLEIKLNQIQNKELINININ